MQSQRSIKHLMWFKWRWMIVGPLNVRCSCVVVVVFLFKGSVVLLFIWPISYRVYGSWGHTVRSSSNINHVIWPVKKSYFLTVHDGNHLMTVTFKSDDWGLNQQRDVHFVSLMHSLLFNVWRNFQHHKSTHTNIQCHIISTNLKLLLKCQHYLDRDFYILFDLILKIFSHHPCKVLIIKLKKKNSQ